MSHKRKPSGWNDVSQWYDGWVGKDGSHFHQKLAIPAVLNSLELNIETQIIDIGCGTGVLAPYLVDIGAEYTGVDISSKLIKKARRYHNNLGRFIVGDARNLGASTKSSDYDIAIFLLSIQDMNPLSKVIWSTSQVVRSGGKIVMLMTHPCFRIPRQSGWGYEQSKKLQYRRIDRYLTPLNIPMKQHKRGTTISFHRPLSTYINTLAQHGFVVNKLDEIRTYQSGANKAEQRAYDEIPIFMLIRAVKS